MKHKSTIDSPIVEGKKPNLDFSDYFSLPVEEQKMDLTCKTIHEENVPNIVRVNTESSESQKARSPNSTMKISLKISSKESRTIAASKRARFFKAASYGSEKKTKELSLGRKIDNKMSTFKKPRRQFGQLEMRQKDDRVDKSERNNEPISKVKNKPSTFVNSKWFKIRLDFLILVFDLKDLDKNKEPKRRYSNSSKGDTSNRHKLPKETRMTQKKIPVSSKSKRATNPTSPYNSKLKSAQNIRTSLSSKKATLDLSKLSKIQTPKCQLIYYYLNAAQNILVSVPLT